MSRQIIVIGSPGSGKSYFSRKLSEITGIPLYHMDNIFWRADRTHITRPELMEAVDAIMKTSEWIIDGNYIGTMGQRMQACQTVIYLDIPEEVCIEGVKNRIGTKRDGKEIIRFSSREEAERFLRECS